MIEYADCITSWDKTTNDNHKNGIKNPRKRTDCQG